jgi:glyceraldehyde 3-phosphate dehydrogenase
LVTRLWLDECAPQLEIVAVNDLVPPDNLAYLLQFDSAHGTFPFPVTAEDGFLVCKNRRIQVTAEADPTKLPWDKLGVDMVLECTGRFTTLEGASQHLKAGAKRVLISAPCKDDVKTICMGVNEETFDPAKDFVLSNASCTTNCLAIIAKVLHLQFGIEDALMTTVHAVTASQPTVDGPSKKDWRGGRSAMNNIIPASTGAAKAVTLCLPELKGKLTGMSLRVPVIDVSVVDLTVKTVKPTSYSAIVEAMEYAAANEMRRYLSVTHQQVVSSDLLSSRESAILDAGAGIELNSQFFKVIAWYDNEMGYSNRLLDLAAFVTAKVR